MSECLDCALFECWYCLQNLGEDVGCCCGRYGPDQPDDDYGYDED